MQFVVIARYIYKSLNVNTVQRVIVADDIDEARKKANILLPKIWCGYTRTTIRIKPYDAQKHATIKSIDVKLSPFKKTEIKVEMGFEHTHRKKRVSFWS